MNKTELIEKIADETNGSKNEAQKFFDALLAGGTTTCQAFTTSSPVSTEEIFAEAQRRGMRTIAGLTGIDRFAPAEFLNTPEQFYRESKRLIETYHRKGRHLYAIGNDAHAARLQGVRVTRRLVSVYVVTGVLVGLAAVVFIGGGGRIGQAVGTGLELQVIAAVVIGGTSILGGRGTVFGTVLGALLVGTVSAAVTLLGWPSELTALFIGVFILVAVGVDLLRQRRRRSL